jgi:hypothetical protein
MLRRTLFIVLVLGLAGIAAVAAPRLSSRLSPRLVAQSTSSPVPFSCYFAGFNQYNNLINSGIACSTPAPGAFEKLVCSGLASCAPSAGPTPAIYVPSPDPTASSVGCGLLSWSGPYSLAGNFSSCAPTTVEVTASPPITVSEAAGPPILYTIACPTCASSSNVVVLQTAPTPSPQPSGYAALSGATTFNGYRTAIVVGPASGGTYYPGAFQISTTGNSGTCGGGGSSAWGTDSTAVQGIDGGMFSVTCANGVGGPWFNVDEAGNVGIPGFIGLGGNVVWPNGCQFSYTENASTYIDFYGSGCTGIRLDALSSSETVCTSGGKILVTCSDPNAQFAGYHVSATGASCTAGVECGSIAFSFPTAYTAPPYCNAPGIQDTTAATTLWTSGIDTISTTEIKFYFAPTTNVTGPDILVFYFTCAPATP